MPSRRPGTRTGKQKENNCKNTKQDVLQSEGSAHCEGDDSGHVDQQAEGQAERRSDSQLGTSDITRYHGCVATVPPQFLLAGLPHFACGRSQNARMCKPFFAAWKLPPKIQLNPKP